MLNLKLKRIEHGMSQKELAEKIGITTSMISNYETGKMEPMVPTLRKLAEVLETTFDHLLER